MLSSTSEAKHETLVLPLLSKQAHKDLQRLYSMIQGRLKAERSLNKVLAPRNPFAMGKMELLATRMRTPTIAALGFVIKKSLSFPVHFLRLSSHHDMRRFELRHSELMSHVPNGGLFWSPPPFCIRCPKYSSTLEQPTNTQLRSNRRLLKEHPQHLQPWVAYHLQTSPNPGYRPH